MVSFDRAVNFEAATTKNAPISLLEETDHSITLLTEDYLGIGTSTCPACERQREKGLKWAI